MPVLATGGVGEAGEGSVPEASNNLILLVNDQPEQVELMSIVLTQAGYGTLLASSAGAALRAAKDSHPQLVIINVTMLDTDGFELCRLMREDEGLASIPVLLVNSQPKDSTSALAGLLAGTEDYLAAPYEPVRLVAKVAQLLERRAGENALRESERYFRTLIESASDMICLLASDGAILYHSPSITRLLGYEEAELRGKKILDFIHPDERDCADRAISSLCSAAPGVLVESHRFLHRDGSWRYFECTYKNLSDNPAAEGILLNGRDTTGRTIAEMSLRRSEAKYRMLMEQASDGICITDGRKVLDVNTRGCEMLGYEREELVGLSIAELNDPEDLGNGPLRLEEIRAGKTLVSERLLRRKDGSLLNVEMSAKALEDGRIQAIVRDITERKLAEEALRKTWHQYEELLNSVEGIVWEADARTLRFTFVSKQAEAILGYPVEQWLSDETFWVDHLFAEDRAWAVAACAKATSEGRSHSLEYRMVGADCRVVWLRDLVSIKLDGEGPTKLRGIMVDITERKRAEETLRSTEQCYRDLVENAKDIIYTHDLEGRYLALNRAGEEITGYTREEAKGKCLAQVIAPEYLEKSHEMLARKLAGEEVTAYDLEIIAKDGRRIAVEVNTRLVYQNGVAVAVQGIARDITERKLTEERIREADQRAIKEYERLLDRLAHLASAFGTARDLQTIFHALCDFSLTLTPSFALIVCLYDDRRSVRTGVYFFGNGREYDPSDVEPIEVREGPASRAIKTGQVVISNDYQSELGTRPHIGVGFEDDDKLPLSALIAPMTIKGRTIGTIEVQSHALGAYTQEHETAMRLAANLAANAIENVQLIEQEREKEEQLRQSQRMEAVGRLAGGIAHDFNNLLTAITGYSDLTLRRLRPEDPLRRNVEEIKKAGDRAASLTRQLLAFSRKQVLQPKVLDLNAVVSDMEKMLPRLIGEDIELRTALAPELGSVRADPGQIEQVLMNLAVNARDAMPHGGNLIIETENVYLNEGYATSHIAVRPGAYVMMAVSDTGEGMNEETQSRIFEPFFTTKEVGKGTGLGLSMVYGIVKQSGGNIWVYSEVGKGTTFKIYLPRVDDAAQEYKRSHQVEEPLDGTETILLAEDDERMRSLVREVLEAYGYRVLEAQDGSVALLLSERHEGLIHLLLTDVVMPKLSGRELADQLAQSHPEIKVLYMSGYTDESIVHHGVLDADTPFIQKPFSPEALARKVRELLDEKA